MSEWTKFRDNILNNLKIDKITEDMKNDLTSYLHDVILPLCKESADSFITQIKEQSAQEHGWYKVRDLVVLPFIITAGIWLVEKTLSETMHGVQNNN